MDLYIESLSGTVFEVRVSPYETILAVKAKLQRMEGIPISQQHLIWNNHELNDDLCLQDYLIPSGSKLKLVLGMRGGPINTRRVLIPPDEPPTVIDPASAASPGGGRHVTVVVLRDGDQLEFYKILPGDASGGGGGRASSGSPLAAIDSAGSRTGWGGRSRNSGGRVAAGATQTQQQPSSTGADSLRERMQKLQQQMDQLKLSRRAGRIAAASGSVATTAGTAASVLVEPLAPLSPQPLPPPPSLLQHSARVSRRLPLLPSQPLPMQLPPPPPLPSQQQPLLGSSGFNTAVGAAPAVPRPLTGRLLAARQQSGHPPMRLPPMPPAEPIGGPSPVAPDAKVANGNRCAACRKRMGLATAYGCRCGGIYCAKHRYPETHDCTFDYKSEGRRLLQEANPVVAAAKLPKI